MKNILVGLIICFLVLTLHVNNANAAVDPRNQPNNKVCIGILSPEAEIEEAAAMVNAKSDWGYVVIIIKKNERDEDRWQGVLNQLAKNRLIPIVRVATSSDSQGYWQRPNEEDAATWADFLSKLYFPTKNKYIQIYNEVNRAGEWGNKVDPSSYASELLKMTNALKSKSEDFFVLNAPLDLALDNSRDSMDAGRYFQLMEMAEPGIFEKIDGWASHSYPNPAFSASPFKSGRLGIDGYDWELSQIAPYLAGKNLPVFITETGWRRSKLLDEETISNYYETAFSEVWTDNRLAAVCPFVFNYPEPLFNDFSFKTDGNVLGKTFYDPYYKIQGLAKILGNPVRENLLGDIKLSFGHFVIKDTPKTVFLTVRNTGNFIWNAKDGMSLNIDAEGVNLVDTHWNRDEVYPGQEATVLISLLTTKTGEMPVKITLMDRNQVLLEKDISVRSETQLARLIRVVTDLI